MYSIEQVQESIKNAYQSGYEAGSRDGESSKVLEIVAILSNAQQQHEAGSHEFCLLGDLLYDVKEALS